MAGFRKIRKFAAAAALALVLPAVALQIAFAADPELLGYAALLDEPEVVERLQLSDEQKQQVSDLVRDRYSETVKAALELRDLPDAEQVEKLAPVIAESERLARELLTEAQQAEFDRIRIGREGPVALAQPEMAAQFALTEEQRQQIEEIVSKRTADLATAPAAQVDAVRATSDQRLLAVLTDDQRQAWTAYVRVAQAAGVSPADDGPLPMDRAPNDGAPIVGAPNDPARAGSGPGRPGSVPLPRIPVAGEPGAEDVGRAGVREQVQERLENVRLRLSFSDAPWGSVIEWLARQAQLSLIMDAPPEGTLDYSSPEEKTLGQTLDFLNQLLQTKGYRLLLKDRLLIVVNLADPIPPTLIDTVAPEELDARGRYELLRTTFKVKTLPIEQAAEAVAALIAPDGTYIALPSSGQIIVTSTGGKLLDVRRYIEEAEGSSARGGFVAVELEHRIADELLPTIRSLFGIAEGASATPDDSLRIAIDPSGTRFLVSGQPQAVERFQTIVEALDVAGPLAGGAASGEPYFDTYPVGPGDPKLTFDVLQTLLAGSPDVRLALNEGNGTVVLLARAPQHETVKSALGLMSKDARKVAVIRLRYVDPSYALQAINLLFGAPAAPASTPASSSGQPAPASAPAASASAPIVVADTLTGMMLIRGSETQIAQIKELLAELGEVESDDPYASDRGNIRTFQMNQKTARDAVSTIQSIWPTVHENRIRVVTPSELAGERIPGGLIDERRAPSSGAATGTTGRGEASFDPSAGGLDNPLELTPEQIEELRGLGVDPSIFMDSSAFPNAGAARLPSPAPGAMRPALPAPGTMRPPIPAPGSGLPRPAVPALEGERPAPSPRAPQTDRPDAAIQAPPADREAARPLPRGVVAQFVSLQEGEAPTQPDAQSPGSQEQPAVDPDAKIGESNADPGANQGPGAVPAVGNPEEDPLENPAPGDGQPPSDEPSNPPSSEDGMGQPSSNGAAAPADDDPPGDVILSITPGGIVYASEDTRSLDEIQAFLESYAATQGPLGPQYTIFYLKHETASAAKQLLEQALTGETDTGSSDGGLLGDIASQAISDVGGGLLGGILGGSGTSTASGDFVIVPNDRLNALFVQANPADLELIEDLLAIIDREKSPEDVLTNGTARVIKLVNLKAADVAEQVKQVYADRMEQQQGQGGQGGRGGGGPSPEDFIRAIAGGGRGGGRGGGGGGGAAPAPAKMTVGVDEASNSLIVRAPEPLFLEVKQLVEDLDAGAQAKTSETMQVLTLKNLSSSSIQASLESILGDTATITSSGPAADGSDSGVGGASRQSGGASGGSSGDSNRRSSDNDGDDARRRAIFDAIRANMNRGGGGGPPQGGPSRGPFPSGGGRGR